MTDLEDKVHRFFAGATRVAVFGVGDDLNPIDRLGLLAARRIHELDIPNVTVFLAETRPESFTASIRRLRASHVAVLDAADMGSAPGTAEVLQSETVRGVRFSTHVLPLTVLLEYLEASVGARTLLVGFQPDLAAPRRGHEPTPAEAAGVENFVRMFFEAVQRIL